MILHQQKFLHGLKIAKNIESEKTEKEIINDFNEIKSGEFHRMGES